MESSCDRGWLRGRDLHLGGSGLLRDRCRRCRWRCRRRHFYWYEPVLVDEKVQASRPNYKTLMKADRPRNICSFSGCPRRYGDKSIARPERSRCSEGWRSLRSLPVETHNMARVLGIGRFLRHNQELSFPFGRCIGREGHAIRIMRVEPPPAK